MTSQPTVAVIICNYNYEKYIGRAIESALSQSVSPSQIIVVDDGSTDASRSVVETYPDVELLSKPNGGQLSAAVVGVASVTSDLIIFLDSDDYLYPDACADVLEHYAEGVSLIQYRLDKIMDGRVVGSYPDYDFMTGDLKKQVLTHGFIHTAPTSGNAFSTRHVRHMFQLLKADEGRNFLDGYLIFSAPFTGAVKAIPSAKGAYVIHGGNVSLSAGRTLKSVSNSIRNARWQRRGFLRLILEKDADLEVACSQWMAASHYRNALVVERGYGLSLLPEFSRTELAFRSATRFLRFPGMPIWKRLASAATSLGLLIAPTALCRKLIPER